MHPEDAAGSTVTARKGFFPVVFGRDVNVRQGGGIAFIARRNLAVTQGGGQWFLSFGDLSVRQGGSAVMAARNVRVSGGFVAVAIAGSMQLENTARVLLKLSIPVALAASVGFVSGLLIGRSRGQKPDAASRERE